MRNYDFLNLSSFEFELLIRDLLQKKINIQIESFTSGKDLGIDLRYTSSNNLNLIIQCKRYKDFKSLFPSLKKELPKVQKLNPNRYIIATSVGLTPPQKDKILELFRPFISTTNDIIGKEDINNLLGLYEDVEKEHYKLWLSSTSVMNKILHSKIINQSNIERDKLIEVSKFYVQNESFPLSLELLEKYNFVIISGLPGIGKSTLARVLTQHFMLQDFEEFIFINNSIDEVYTLFDDEKSQVFLYDDFLGKNFLTSNKGNKEDENIVSFIKKIKKSPNKKLIFTTREYILKQAQLEYELLNLKIIDNSKCIIDLSKYTEFVKSRILYNHLYFNGLPQSYISEIIQNKFYQKIISHKNYNPRIIQEVTQKEIWQDISPVDYPKLFLKFLDYPESVWKFAYEKHISKLSKYILALLLTTGTPILLDDLDIAIDNFFEHCSKKYKANYDDFSKNESIKELTNTFISTEMNPKGGTIIKYQNPSIQDFLVHYLSRFPDLLAEIIRTASFINQLSVIFSFKANFVVMGKNVPNQNKIILSSKLQKIYLEKVIEDYDKLSYSNVDIAWEAANKEIEFFWFKQELTEVRKIHSIINDKPWNQGDKFESFINNKFIQLINSDIPFSNYDDMNSLVRIFNKIYPYIKINVFQVLNKILKLIKAEDEFWAFCTLRRIYSLEFEKLINESSNLKSTLNLIVESIVNKNPVYDLQSTLNSLKRIQSEFRFPLNKEINLIEAKIITEEVNKENSKYTESMIKAISRSMSLNSEKEKQKIKELFDSLRK